MRILKQVCSSMHGRWRRPRLARAGPCTCRRHTVASRRTGLACALDGVAENEGQEEDGQACGHLLCELFGGELRADHGRAQYHPPHHHARHQGVARYAPVGRPAQANDDVVHMRDGLQLSRSEHHARQELGSRELHVGRHVRRAHGQAPRHPCATPIFIFERARCRDWPTRSERHVWQTCIATATTCAASLVPSSRSAHSTASSSTCCRTD